MNQVNQIAKLLFFLTLSIFFFGLALLFPVYFNSLSTSVLTSYTNNTDEHKALVESYLKEGKTGVIDILQQSLTPPDQQTRDVEHSLEEKPEYHLLGGLSPSLLPFIRAIQSQNANSESSHVDEQTLPAITLFLPKEHHKPALEILQTSADPLVAAILSTQQLNNYQYFKPIDTPGGHPLKATILLTAFLAQSNNLSPLLRDKLQTLALSASTEKDIYSISILEDTYWNIATLGKRLDWAQLTELTPFFDDLETLQKTAKIVRLYPENLPLLYTSILLSEQIDQPLDYIDRYNAESWEAIKIAINSGKENLTKLWETNKPIYKLPQFLKGWEPLFSKIHFPQFLITFSSQTPFLAIGIKVIIFLFASFILTMTFVPSQNIVKTQRSLPLQIAIASLLALLIWLITEPNLFLSQKEIIENISASLVFDLSNKFIFNEIIINDNFNTMFDFATTFTLLVFFISQLIVYFYGLMKLNQIKSQEIAPWLKIKLLENDENLFDLGLYVGLGGTILSLILLALGVKQVSLMAAYASTLFGIIFVATLKIFHARPFRQQLILQIK